MATTSVEASLLSYLGKYQPQALEQYQPEAKSAIPLPGTPQTSAPLTNVVPVVTDEIIPVDIATPVVARPIVVPSIPDSNVQPIQAGNVVTPQVATVASGNPNAVPEAAPTSVTAPPITNEGPNDAVTGSALIGTGIANVGESEAPVSTTAPSQLVPQSNIESFFTTNPIASAVIAGLILFFMTKFFGSN